VISLSSARQRHCGFATFLDDSMARTLRPFRFLSQVTDPQGDIDPKSKATLC
jgi:hypothetical protein